MIVTIARYVSCCLFGACIVAYGPDLWSEWRWRRVDRVARRKIAEAYRQIDVMLEDMEHARSLGRDEALDVVSTIRILDGVLDPPIPARQRGWHPTDGTTPPSWEAYASVLDSRGKK